VLLNQKSVITPDQFGRYLEKNEYALWLAINHHRTHTNKRMTLKNHFYLKEILTDKSRFRVLKKSTQGGVSEALIILAWSMAKNGAVVFYVLPTHQLMERFVSNRFEKSMMFSPYYREQRAAGKSKEYAKEIIDNRSLKDIGLGVVNFAGSKSDVPFVEIPADRLIVDEADNCDPKRLEMGKERLGHSSDPHEIYVGNPTFVGSFLDQKYSESTQSQWHVHHDCGHWIKINFFDHVLRQVDEHEYVIRDKDFDYESDIDVQPICDKCGKAFDRFSDGAFVPQKESIISGKQISRVFSGTSPLVKMVDKFSKALENDYKMQRFYNSELGESYTAEGSKISRRMVENCVGDYLMSGSSNGPCIMGVDVGNTIHVRINRLLPDKRKQAVYIGTVLELPELLSLCKQYHVISAVIDAMPEIRLARQFSHSMPGYFRCFFGSDKSDNISPKEKTVTVSRTMALDDMKEMFVTNRILLPKNITTIDEYMDHIQEPTRTWDEDRKEYVWVSNRPDHFFFAEVYCTLAEKVLKFIT
jgi:hypothetical protein